MPKKLIAYANCVMPQKIESKSAPALPNGEKDFQKKSKTGTEDIMQKTPKKSFLRTSTIENKTESSIENIREYIMAENAQAVGAFPLELSKN